MARRLVAELLGTAFLLVAIVGSGIATSGDAPASTQLFQHAVAIGAALTALILTFGPVSGAHFNPVVTAVDAAFGGLTRRAAALYVVAQVTGAVLGTVVANVIFAQPAIVIGTQDRTGLPLAASEAVATAGLVLVIFGMLRSDNARAVPAAVGAYIAAAIFFTSSAAFANPAVTVARTLTDTYTAMRPDGVLPFLAAQAAGGLAAWALVRWLFAPDPDAAARVVVPHDLDESTARRP